MIAKLNDSSVDACKLWLHDDHRFARKEPSLLSNDLHLVVLTPKQGATLYFNVFAILVGCFSV